MILTQPETGISAVLEPLQFDKGDNQKFYADTLQAFHSMLYESLDEVKSKLGATGNRGLNELRELLANLDAASLDNYLVQPEVSNVLLYRNQDNITQLNGFLLRTLAAEIAKKTHKYEIEKYDQLWSANGDYLIAYDASTSAFEEYEALKVLDRVPIDFFSPYCQSLSHDDINEDKQAKFELYSIEEAEDIFEFMESSLHPVLHCRNIIELSCLFNNVIMVKKQTNHDGRMPFISGSDGFYIGRTHVMNPKTVVQEVIAETFVHEATHSILYILDEHKSWMPTMNDLLRIGSTVPSNWSGNLLSIRSYFQAVFVWFGIFNFWKYALNNSLYDREFVVKRLEFVRNGFRTLDMDDITREYNLKLPAETIETVNEAKKIVMS